MLVEKIQEAVWKLQELGSREEDIIIAFSKITERFLMAELNDQCRFVSPPIEDTMKQLIGMNVNNEWPYNNKIVVYDKFNASYYPKFIIEITLHTSTIIKTTITLQDVSS